MLACFLSQKPTQDRWMDKMNKSLLDSNGNTERQCLWCCHHGTATERVHPVHLINVARASGGCWRLDQANHLEPQINCLTASYGTTFIIIIYYYSASRLILISQSHGGEKAESTWVAGCILRWFTCMQSVTHPCTNRARQGVTSQIRHSMLLLCHGTNHGQHINITQV